MRYYFPVLLALASLTMVTAFAPAAIAQISSQDRAQALYFESEAALAAGQLDRAEQYRAQAVSLLGSSNAKLVALEVRILVAQTRYLDAKERLDQFYRYDPGPNLRRDMAPYMLRIDAKLEEERLAELERAKQEEIRKAEAAAELEKKNRIRDLARTCVDEPSCISAQGQIRKLSAAESDEYRMISAKLCQEFRRGPSCEAILRSDYFSGFGKKVTPANHRQMIFNSALNKFAVGVLCLTDYQSERLGEFSNFPYLSSGSICISALDLTRTPSMFTSEIVSGLALGPEIADLAIDVANKNCSNGSAVGCRYLVEIHADDRHATPADIEKYKLHLGRYCRVLIARGFWGGSEPKKLCRENGYKASIPKYP